MSFINVSEVAPATAAPSISRGMCASPSDAPRQLTPTVLEPSRAQLARLCPADRAILANFLRQQIDYTENPVFHERGAEKHLFGDKSPTSDGWTQTRQIERNSNGTLTTRHQSILFQQLNFARREQLEILWKFREKRIPLPILRTLLGWIHIERSVCNTLMQANLPLVLAMTRKVRTTDGDFNELISEGNLALLRCVRKFDCSRGFQFSTYACGAILKSFSRAGMRHAKYRSRCPVEFDPGLERSDYADRRHVEAESMYLETMNDILRENRADLNAQEQAVLRIRFTIGETCPPSKSRTLEEVGVHVGVTKERVRQVQNRALRKLREVLRAT